MVTIPSDVDQPLSSEFSRGVAVRLEARPDAECTRNGRKTHQMEKISAGTVLPSNLGRGVPATVGMRRVMAAFFPLALNPN